ncbi:MAG: T9SS type A sorting domain-containing protein, partial [Bacteroidia bacterium]|nr:T9SS type A sorting domain-containing protein [Bacteroidia bacterium]
NAPLTNVSLVEYWQCDRSGTGNANLSLYWEDASLSGITTCTDLTIAHWNGSSWDEKLGTAGGTCSGTGAGSVITNALITTFSPFTFGSKTLGNINPLPITLLTFTAIPVGKNVRVNWSTATEKDVDYYEVEKSKDGINFEFVDKIKSHGNGNSTSTMNYTTVDQNPYKGVSYYRLKQLDKDKTVFYSSVVTVNFNEALKTEFSLYPNPTSKEFFVEGDFNENTELIITNVLGKIITPSILTKTNLKINVDCSILPAGVYFITVKNGDEMNTKKVIIK